MKIFGVKLYFKNNRDNNDDNQKKKKRKEKTISIEFVSAY